MRHRNRPRTDRQRRVNRAAAQTGPLAQRVARNVKQLRERQRMPLTQLAARLAELGTPIARLGLYDLEKGTRKVSVDELAALAQLFGVAQPWDLTGDICDTCCNAPPAGFRCVSCDRTAATP